MLYIDAGREILNMFFQKGFEAYFVGGFVRDKLLGRTSEDIDITTNAKPQEILQLFDGILVGEKYGTIIIKYKGFLFETTTFRCDGLYNDNRHPENVQFSDKLEEDLKRRDFKMNALVMDKDGHINDYFGGLEDLSKKVISCIGEPYDRFKEDALRILRAFSFMAKLGFSIEDKTLLGIKKAHHLISNLKAERIYNELYKITQYGSLKPFIVLRDAEIELHDLNEAIDFSIKKQTNINLDCLFVLTEHFKGEISPFWRLKAKDRRKYHLASEMLKKPISRRIIFDFGEEVSYLMAEVYNLLYNESVDMEKEYQALPIKSIKELAIKGNDLLKYYQGHQIKEALDRIIDLILNEELTNSFDNIIDEVKKWNMMD